MTTSKLKLTNKKIVFTVDGTTFRRQIWEQDEDTYIYYYDELWKVEDIEEMVRERHGKIDIVK